MNLGRGPQTHMGGVATGTSFQKLELSGVSGEPSGRMVLEWMMGAGGWGERWDEEDG